MVLAVLGSTGFTGKIFLRMVDTNVHKVRLLVRNKSKLDAEILDNKNVLIIEGDAQNYEDVLKVVDSSDVVVSFLGHSKKTKWDLQEKSTINILKAMNDSGTNRLMVMTGSAVFFENDKPSLIDRLLRSFMLFFARKRLLDAERMCEIIKQSDVNWTVVRCPLVTNKLSYSMPKIYEKHNGKPFISVSVYKVARFIHNEIIEENYSRKAPIISDF